MRYEYRHGGNVHAETGGERFLDFSASINPLGPPKQVEAAIHDALRFIDRYPDSRSFELRKCIAAFEGVPPEWIFCGGGSSDILFRLPRAIDARRGLVLTPSFSDYRRALTAARADIVYHPLREQSGFACDECLLKTLESNSVDLLILCNPNNPTGLLTERKRIEQILRISNKKGTVVLVDECFMELVEKSDETTAKPFLEEFENLVVLKAFTKTFALPGLRLGYAICSNVRLLDKIASVGPDWPVSNLAQAAGIAALRDTAPYLDESLALIEKERRFVKTELEKLGYKVYDGRAHFLFAKNPYEFDIKAELDHEGIRIRSFTVEDGLGPNYFRIGISTRENNFRLINALRKTTQQSSHKEPEMQAVPGRNLRVESSKNGAPKKSRNLMILGTASGVGKSILSIGICRILHKNGCRVAPFKSQNMSGNAHVFPDGLEMSKAQAIAAWACEIEPHVDMNPILLKPVRGGTDVIVQGRSIGWMDRNRYKEFKRREAWISVMESYERLSSRHETIILEGAGSPVEMNMKDDDIANMSMAGRVDAPVVLVADIERGGVFADVKGTLALLSEKERRSVLGLVVNKCRGQIELFDEVRQTMEEMADIPVLGMLPYWDIEIEDEDGLCDPGTGLKTDRNLNRRERNRQFDRLADMLREHLDMGLLHKIIERGTVS